MAKLKKMQKGGGAAEKKAQSASSTYSKPAAKPATDSTAATARKTVGTLRLEKKSTGGSYNKSVSFKKGGSVKRKSK